MNVAGRVEAALRSDGPRLIAALARQYRDIERAQDAVQEAALRALESWPVRGVPDNPAAWLFTVARHHLVDGLRREPSDSLPDTLVAEPPADDRLALLFACCHPAIAPRSQVGLALWTLCGLSMEAIARAFLERPETASRRLRRASQKIRMAGIPFAIPGPAARKERIAAVLAAIYLLFNEGYASTDDDVGVHVETCEHALFLGRSVASLMPDEPEIHGLVALMTLHHARRDGRFAADGSLLTLEQQDRSSWHLEEVERGAQQLDTALSHRRPGPYQIQAAIAALHAQAPTAEDTDWNQITALYGSLLRHTPSPVVELNAAVALAMSTTPQRGLAWLDQLVDRGVLSHYPLLHASRANLLARMKRTHEAREAYAAALSHTKSPREQAFLRRQQENLHDLQRRTRLPTGRSPRPLADRDWRRVRVLFPEQRGRGRPRRPDRLVLEGILWVLTTGLPWRRVPNKYGPWQTLYHRFRVWENDGRMASVFRRLAHHPGAVRGRSMPSVPSVYLSTPAWNPTP